ncbi:MAG: hypothetical protein ACI4R8_03385 [Candidatus Caccovivens sp.]
MQTSMLLGMFDWVADFFKALFDLIPKIMYLLYASVACVLDVLQLFFRKLAGLDVYYVDGKPVTGDLVTNFITGILGINSDGFTYSALSTVFWSMVIFGVIMCFACTIVAIIKSHYSYDEKSAKGPMQYVYAAGKAIINMVAVPIIVVLGLYVSEAILTALDTITSVSSSSVVEIYGDKVSLLESVATAKDIKTDEDGNLITVNEKQKTYVYYDIFGFAGGVQYGKVKEDLFIDHKDSALVGAKNQTFSGSLFKVAAYNANRARIGDWYHSDIMYTGKAGSKLELFANAKSNEQLADMIDTAFACNLHLKGGNSVDFDYSDLDILSFTYFTNFLSTKMAAFSKFNVGAVWYYYDLWQFNFIVGFAGIIVCVSIFINIILGLITRLFMCIGLFLVSPPLWGIAPLDGGKAGKSWRENFMKQVLMAYGAVLGMNIMFLILPYMNEIAFFNIAIADYLAQTLIIIVGLITIKAFISTFSGLIGGADANDTGGKISEEVGSVVGKATLATVGAAKMGKAVFDRTPIGAATNAAGMAIGHGAKQLASKMSSNKVGKALGTAGKAVGNWFKDPKSVMGAAGNAILKADSKHTSNKYEHKSEEETNKALDAQNKLDNFDGYLYEQARSKALDQVYATASWTGSTKSSRRNAAIKTLTDVGYSKEQAKQMVKEMQRMQEWKVPGVRSIHDATDALDNSMRNILSNNIDEHRKKAQEHKDVADRYSLASIQHGQDRDAAWKKASDASLNLGAPLSFAYDQVKGDKFIGSFMDKSKIKEKPDFEKETSKNTAATSKQQKIATDIQTWQAMHPGETMSSDVLEQIKEGKWKP